MLYVMPLVSLIATVTIADGTASRSDARKTLATIGAGQIVCGVQLSDNQNRGFDGIARRFGLTSELDVKEITVMSIELMQSILQQYQDHPENRTDSEKNAMSVFCKELKTKLLPTLEQLGGNK
jgi:hypothetical protein